MEGELERGCGVGRGGGGGGRGLGEWGERREVRSDGDKTRKNSVVFGHVLLNNWLSGIKQKLVKLRVR